MKLGEKKQILGSQHVCVKCRECEELIWVRGESKTTSGVCIECDPDLVRTGGIPNYRQDPRGLREAGTSTTNYDGLSSGPRFNYYTPPAPKNSKPLKIFRRQK